MAQLADNHALLLYRVGPVLCCAPTAPVEGLIPPPPLTRPPGSSSASPGIFRHDGHTVRLLEARELFGVEPDQRQRPGKVILCQFAGRHHGFLVDEIIDVIESPASGWGRLSPSLTGGVFSRSLLLDERIHLYTELEKLQELRHYGFLKPWIEQLEEKPAAAADTATAASSATAGNRTLERTGTHGPLSQTAPASRRPSLREVPPPAASAAAASVANEAPDKSRGNGGGKNAARNPGKNPDKDSASIESRSKPRGETRPGPRASLTANTAAPARSTAGTPPAATAAAQNRAAAPAHNPRAGTPVPPSAASAGATRAPAKPPPTPAAKPALKTAPEPTPVPASEPPVSTTSAPASAETGLFAPLLLLLGFGLAAGLGIWWLLQENAPPPAPSGAMVSHPAARPAPVSPPPDRPPRETVETTAPQPAPATMAKPVPPAAETNPPPATDETWHADIRQEEQAITIVLRAPQGVPVLRKPPVSAAEAATEPMTETATDETKPEPAPTAASDGEAAATKPASPAVAEVIVHVVVRGDTLWDIAKRYIHDPFRYPELARLNRIRNPDLIYPGDRVRIVHVHSPPAGPSGQPVSE